MSPCQGAATSRAQSASARIFDPFGHRRGLAQHLRDVSHDEIAGAAMAAFTGPAGPDRLTAGSSRRGTVCWFTPADAVR